MRLKPSSPIKLPILAQLTLVAVLSTVVIVGIVVTVSDEGFTIRTILVIAALIGTYVLSWVLFRHYRQLD